MKFSPGTFAGTRGLALWEIAAQRSAKRSRGVSSLLALLASGAAVTMAPSAGADTFNFTHNLVSYNVTHSGVYDILVKGAQGGDGGIGDSGGSGATVEGHISLVSGTVLSIVVGGAGLKGSQGGGGGGGSFVFVPGDAQPLIVGGGGGGAGRFSANGGSGQTGTSGDAGGGSGGAGGTSGTGGAGGGNFMPFGGGGGGGGWSGNGTAGDGGFGAGGGFGSPLFAGGASTVSKEDLAAAVAPVRTVVVGEAIPAVVEAMPSVLEVRPYASLTSAAVAAVHITMRCSRM